MNEARRFEQWTGDNDGSRAEKRIRSMIFDDPVTPPFRAEARELLIEHQA
jgi:hypothetical protein